MVDKLNIPLESKLTKVVNYLLNLDDGYWRKSEEDFSGDQVYHETSRGYWRKLEYDTEGNVIYYENSNGVIQDDRKN